MSIVSPEYAKYKKLKIVDWVAINDGEGNNNFVCIVDADIKNIDNEETFGRSIECEPGNKFQPCPNMSKENKQRIVYYISGQSGSGKTTIASNIAKIYKKRFPKNKIVFISPKPIEGVMKDLNPVIINVADENKAYNNFVNEETKIKIDESLDKTELDNTLCIFDDIEGVPKKIREKIIDLINNILFLGRHRSISICYLTHITCNNKETKGILTEANAIITFPTGKITKPLKYVYENHCGMDRKIMEALSNVRSRWICVYRNYPPHVITENQIFLY